MTPQTAFAVLVYSGLAAAPALAIEPTSGLTGCAAKASAIGKQIEQARAAGNTYQQTGLEKALRQSGAHCTDAGLKQQRAEKVDKANKKVSQRKADLTAALQSGDIERINKRKQKLAQAEQGLQAARANLSSQ